MSPTSYRTAPPRDKFHSIRNRGGPVKRRTETVGVRRTCRGMAGHTHFDETTEEYLEAVYRLEREGPGVTTSALASELGVSPASVSGMLKKLANEGYIEHRARGEAKLTRKGLEIAVRVMRRHRHLEPLPREFCLAARPVLDVAFIG